MFVPTFRKTLAGKIAAFLIGLLVLFVSVASIGGISLTNSQIISSQEEGLLRLLDGKEKELALFFELMGARVEDFSSDGFIRDAVVRIQQGDEDVVEELRRHLIKNKIPLDSRILDSHIIGLDGVILSSAHREEHGKSISEEDWWQDVRSSRDEQASIISNVYENTFNHDPKFMFIAAHVLTDRVTGEEIGYITNHFSVEEICDIACVKNGGTYEKNKGAYTSYVVNDSSEYIIGGNTFKKRQVCKSKKYPCFFSV